MKRRARQTLVALALALAVASTLTPTIGGVGATAQGEVQVSTRGIEVSSLPERKVPGPSRSTGTYTARILVTTPIRRRPGKPATEWLARTTTKWSGDSQKLMVLRSRRVDGKTWLKVRLPTRPNGSGGWLPRDRVILGHSHYFILIDTSRRRLWLYRSGRKAATWRVVVGAPATPTPTGLFALYDRVKQKDPHGFIGPWAVPLTAHSNKLRRYDGGPGLVAIHGRDGASLLDPLGTAASHGCIRMNNSRVRRLIGTSMGTAVKVRR
ncbi:MAG: L,D-transpeptidase [Solirubrobacterales bacterium]|nr:L,D-transpeptidase [Solirubrobacterales bacterium]